MSTRATYLFESEELNPIYFYVHYDGYPSGAAHYFYLMQQCENKRGGLAEQFMRSVDLAEFTKDHEYHWDTEYRYTFDKNGYLSAWERDRENREADVWDLFFEGSWYRFVNQFSESNVFLDEFKIADCCNEVLTLNQAQLRARQRKAHASEYFQFGHIAQANTAYADAQHLQQHIMDILQNNPTLFETLETDKSDVDHMAPDSFRLLWTIDDVLLNRPAFTYEQAINVLKTFEEKCRSSEVLGRLEDICNNLYPNAPMQ